MESVKVYPNAQCKYNPERDLQAVVPSDVIDICDAFLNGSIPENVTITDVEFDGNDNPEAIVGRPANEFEAMHMIEGIKDAQAVANQSEQN